MFSATTPTSELEAVNLMLSLLGISPVSTLATDDADVTNALMILRAETRAVCAMDWVFNHRDNVLWVPGVGGKIDVPTNVVRVTPYVAWNTPVDMREVKFTVRGEGGVMRLYDRINNTFVWTQSLYVRITELLAFEDIPEPVRWYIAIRAGRVFLGRYDGSDTRYKLSEKDEVEALRTLTDYELEDQNANFLDGEDVAVGWVRE